MARAIWLHCPSKTSIRDLNSAHPHFLQLCDTAATSDTATARAARRAAGAKGVDPNGKDQPGTRARWPGTKAAGTARRRRVGAKAKA
eukprot:571029-Amphidinium_carterae.1